MDERIRTLLEDPSNGYPDRGRLSEDAHYRRLVADFLGCTDAINELSVFARSAGESRKSLNALIKRFDEVRGCMWNTLTSYVLSH